MQKKDNTDMKKETLIKRVNAFNEELEKYYKETENCEVPDIETSVIGGGGIIQYSIDELTISRSETSSFDSFYYEYALTVDDEWDDLLEQIKYDRRRLKKGWRVWRSENPDLELEKDDEE